MYRMTLTETIQTDEQLVTTSLAGDKRAFEALVRRYQNLVYGLCFHWLGRFEDAQDAAQTAFVTAYRQLEALRNGSEFRAWLRIIATNECRQRLRAARVAKSLEEEDAWIAPAEVIDLQIDVQRAIAGLGEDNRLAILLFYFHRYSLREIATFLDVPETTVMSRIRNSRAQLKKEIRQMTDDTIIDHSLPTEFAERLPIPYDEYDHRKLPRQATEPLSEWRREWLLSHFPAGSSIESSGIAGHDWQREPDRPVTLIVRMPSGKRERVVLRMCARKGGVETEAEILPILERLRIPAPRLIGEPTLDPALPQWSRLIATTSIPGRNVLAWAQDGGFVAAERACEVIFEAMEILSGVTREFDGIRIERCTLAQELSRTIELGGPWLEHPEIAEAVQILEPVVARIDERPIFSDSGIGPNVFVDEAGNFTGFESFAWARVEDPHYQVTKYWTYDCWPVRRAGFVERYLVRHGLTLRDFAPRLGVRALATLQREIPVTGGDPGYREDMLDWLRMALAHL